MKIFTTQIFSSNLNINSKTMLILPPLYEFNEFDTSLAKVISDLDTDAFYSLDFYIFSGHVSDYIDSELVLPESDSNHSLNTELLNYIEAGILTKGYMKTNTFFFAHQDLESIDSFVEEIYNELDASIHEAFHASKEPANEESLDSFPLDGSRHIVLTIKQEAVI
jgi:hypothetical protein